MTVDLHHVVSGRTDGPALILSNSLGSTYRMWDANLAALESQFLLVRYDTRGHGASPTPTGPYLLDDLVDDLIRLMDRLELPGAHLAGLSLGGMISMGAAISYPERVDRLVALCTGAQLPPSADWLARAETVRKNGTGAIADAVVARWFTPDYLSTHPEVVAASKAMITATAPEGYAGCCEALAAANLRDDLTKIDSPTLAIAGEEDPVTPPAYLAEIAESVRTGRLLVVPNAAHLANIQHPEVINPAIIDHLIGEQEPR